MTARPASLHQARASAGELIDATRVALRACAAFVDPSDVVEIRAHLAHLEATKNKPEVTLGELRLAKERLERARREIGQGMTGAPAGRVDHPAPPRRPRGVLNRGETP